MATKGTSRRSGGRAGGDGVRWPLIRALGPKLTLATEVVAAVLLPRTVHM
jgi:hypothetical protein